MTASPDIVAQLRAEVAWEADIGNLLERAANVIESLRAEVRTQRQEIAGLREERRALLANDRFPLSGNWKEP